MAPTESIDESAALVAATLVVVVLAVPAAAQVTPDDVEQARQRVAELQGDLDGAVVRYDEALTRYNILEGDIAQMSTAIEDTEQRVERSRQLLEDRAIEIYMGAASTGASMLSLSATPEELETGVGYLEELGVSERSCSPACRRRRRSWHPQYRARRGARQQAAVRDEPRSCRRDRRPAADRPGRLRDRPGGTSCPDRGGAPGARRQNGERLSRQPGMPPRPLPLPPATIPLLPIPPRPIRQPTTHSYGERRRRVLPGARAQQLLRHLGRPRSGGRYHKGVDIMAARGTPVVAVYDGSIYRFSTSSLGGYTIYYQDNSGNIYYYAHLRRVRRRCSRRRPHGRRRVARLRR